jgi:hypothetical protein
MVDDFTSSIADKAGWLPSVLILTWAATCQQIDSIIKRKIKRFMDSGFLCIAIQALDYCILFFEELQVLQK